MPAGRSPLSGCLLTRCSAGPPATLRGTRPQRASPGRSCLAHSHSLGACTTKQACSTRSAAYWDEPVPRLHRKHTQEVHNRRLHATLVVVDPRAPARLGTAATHRMPHMYSRRSRLFCMTASWKNGTLGAVRGTSTDTCRQTHKRGCSTAQTSMAEVGYLSAALELQPLEEQSSYSDCCSRGQVCRKLLTTWNTRSRPSELASVASPSAVMAVQMHSALPASMHQSPPLSAGCFQCHRTQAPCRGTHGACEPAPAVGGSCTSTRQSEQCMHTAQQNIVVVL